MFCTKCGSRLEEGARFCVKCGASVESHKELKSVTYEADASSDDGTEQSAGIEPKTDTYTEQVINNSVHNKENNTDLGELAEKAGSMAKSAKNIAQNAAGTVADNVKTYVSSEKVQSIKNDKKLIQNIVRILIAVVVLVTGGFAFSKLHKHALNLEDYAVFEYSGCNNYGTANVYYDSWQLTTDIMYYGRFDNKSLKEIQKKLKKSGKKHEAAKEYLEDLIDDAEERSLWGTDGTAYGKVEDLYYDMDNYIRYELDRSEGLTNGDEVTISFDYDKDVFKKYGIRLKGTTVKDKVKDLVDAKEVDPFEKISVEFEGISPHVTANLLNNNDEISGYFTAHIDGDKQEFRAGDKVVVVLDANEQGLLTDMGIHLTSLSKEYICEGVNAYAESAADISEDIMESMRAQSEDAFRANVANDWSDEVKLKKVEPIGNYFLKTKEGMYSDYNNQLYLIFKITAKKKGEKKFSYYYYTRFHDIIMLSDGTCSVDTSSYDVPSYGGWFTDGETFEKQELTYTGYLDLNSLFNNCVTSQVETNEYENNIVENSGDDKASDDAAEDNDEAAEDGGDEAVNDGDYIIPDSDSRLLTEEDIESLTLKELNYAKNEIYARHGRKFESAELNDYFGSKSWYNGTIEPNDFSDDMLSEIERNNVKLLKERELSIDPEGYSLDS